MWDEIVGMIFAAGMLIIFAVALGQAVDVQASRSDPLSVAHASKPCGLNHD